MALSIKISSYVSGGYTNPVIWRLYEDVSGILIDDHQEMGPHGQVYNFSWSTNIRDIIYRIVLYDQPGGTGIGQIIKSHVVSVTTSVISMDADIETIVDGGQPEDPVSGTQTSPPIPGIAGADFYVVQRSIGQRRVERLPEIIINSDGSYTFIGDETFNPYDTFIIKIRPKYIVNPAGSQTASTIYRDTMLITSDYTVLATDMGKKLIVDGMLPVVTINLLAIADTIPKVSLWIESVGSNHVNVVVKAQVGETITATGEVSNTFILSRAVHAEILVLDGIIYGFTDDGDIKCRGQIEWGYSVGLNRLKAYGVEYLTADYPGLKKAMDAMQTGTVVTYTQWFSSVVVDGATVYPYKGFFALSDDGSHFIVPDLRDLAVIGLNGDTTDPDRLTQGPGGFGKQQMLSHGHFSFSNAASSGDASPVDPNTTPVASNELNNNLSYRIKGKSTAATLGKTSLTGGAKNRIENIGLIPLIII